MQVVLNGRVTDIRSKSGISYVTFLDRDEGGLVQLSIPGGEQLKIDTVVALDCKVKCGRGQYGMYIKVIEILKKGDK